MTSNPKPPFDDPIRRGTVTFPSSEVVNQRLEVGVVPRKGSVYVWRGTGRPDVPSVVSLDRQRCVIQSLSSHLGITIHPVLINPRTERREVKDIAIK